MGVVCTESTNWKVTRTADKRRLDHVSFEGVAVRSRAASHDAAAGVPTGGTDGANRHFARGKQFVERVLVREEAAAPQFLEWLLKRAGLDARAYRGSALTRRLPACLRALRVSTEAEAKAALERKPEWMGRAVDAVLIGVSSFFRDEGVFESLGQLLRARGEMVRGGLRVYSVGCSDGQELYSAGILLAELGWLEGSELAGTDCRTEAIARARRGWYGPAEMQRVPEDLRDRYFRAEGGGFSAVPRLRERTSWQVGNLLNESGPGGAWDVILFRNVGMYLKPEVAADVWKGLVDRLSPGGLLASGKAERPPRGLGLKRVGLCLYMKTE